MNFADFKLAENVLALDRLADYQHADLDNSTVSNNTATNGGGITITGTLVTTGYGYHGQLGDRERRRHREQWQLHDQRRHILRKLGRSAGRRD